MSGLSPEALASLGGLNLQDVKTDLSFSPAEKKKPLMVELDWLEKDSIRFWNFDKALEKLNALGTKPAPREDVVLPEIKTEADQPDWLTSDTSDEEAPAAPRAPLWQEELRQEEEPAGPRQAWDQLSHRQRNNDLGDWYRQWQEGVEPEDWQKQALKEFNVWAGDEPPAPVDHAEEDDSDNLPSTEEDKKLFSAEGMKVAFKSYLSSWFDKNRVQVFANLGGGAAVGFLANMCFTELIAQNRQMAAFLPKMLTGLQSISILTANTFDFSAATALTMRGRSELFERHLKAASLAEHLAVSRSADNLIDKIFIAGPAAAKLVRGITLHPGTMGFVSGAWLYAALSGAGVFGESGLTHQAHAVSPADSGGAGGAESGAGQEQAGGNSGEVGADDRGEANVQPPAGGGADTSPQFPTQDSPLAPVSPEDLEQLPNLVDSAEAARIVALNEGQTVEQIMAAMPQQQQTVSEAILKIIGDIPHGGEITNVIYRAAGEDDVGKLHEGAIRALANSLSDLFSKADVAANNFGVPYDKGVLNAVNNTQSLGPNSAVANAIRAGNLGDLEAATKIREEVFRPILGALAK